MVTTIPDGAYPGRDGERGGDDVLRIDCAECELEGTTACLDCVVTFIVGLEPGVPLEVRPAEVITLRALAEGGLAPALRHRPRCRPPKELDHRPL
jgi:hypothetical protein